MIYHYAGCLMAHLRESNQAQGGEIWKAGQVDTTEDDYTARLLNRGSLTASTDNGGSGGGGLVCTATQIELSDFTVPGEDAGYITFSVDGGLDQTLSLVNLGGFNDSALEMLVNIFAENVLLFPNAYNGNSTRAHAFTIGTTGGLELQGPPMLYGFDSDLPNGTIEQHVLRIKRTIGLLANQVDLADAVLTELQTQVDVQSCALTPAVFY